MTPLKGINYKKIFHHPRRNLFPRPQRQVLGLLPLKKQQIWRIAVIIILFIITIIVIIIVYYYYYYFCCYYYYYYYYYYYTSKFVVTVSNNWNEREGN